MRNRSIIQKIMLIVGMLGVFVLGVAYYATGQMRRIDDGYSALIAGNETAAIDLSHANRQLEEIRYSIAALAMTTSDGGDATAKAAMDHALSMFKDYTGAAARLSPQHADGIETLRAQAISVVGDQCAKAIASGLAASSGPDLIMSQKEFLTGCAQISRPPSPA